MPDKFEQECRRPTDVTLAIQAGSIFGLVFLLGVMVGFVVSELFQAIRHVPSTSNWGVWNRARLLLVFTAPLSILMLTCLGVIQILKRRAGMSPEVMSQLRKISPQTLIVSTIIIVCQRVADILSTGMVILLVGALSVLLFLPSAGSKFRLGAFSNKEAVPAWLPKSTITALFLFGVIVVIF